MTDKEFVLSVLRENGRTIASELQKKSASMDGTTLNAQSDYIPDFVAAKKKTNMLERNAGFVCVSSEGRVVRLIQPYDSDIYTGEPETLPAQWGFVWSHDPAKALPFVAISTSPYGIGDCCTENGKTYMSTIENNVFSPSSYPQGWEEVMV